MKFIGSYHSAAPASLVLLSFSLLTAPGVAPAQSPSTNLHLSIELRPDSLELVVDGSAASGALFIYQAPSLSALLASPAVPVQTNTPLTNGLRFSLPAAFSAQAFFRAVHWPGLAFIPARIFTMGSPDSEPGRAASEGPQTQVTITRAFCIGKYAVTQGDYLEVMGNNPSYFVAANGAGTDLKRPVEQVSWNDAVAYCSALTARERNAGRLAAGWLYRLPTEAERECACRAGTTTAFHYGDALRSGMANFYGLYEYPPCGGSTTDCANPGGIWLARTTSGERYLPNAWGLYDMHGNVLEWCSDWFSGNLPGGSVTDPQGPTTGSSRVVRGGGWASHALYCRSAVRSGTTPDSRYRDFGFRVVLAPGQP